MQKVRPGGRHACVRGAQKDHLTNRAIDTVCRKGGGPWRRSGPRGKRAIFGVYSLGGHRRICGVHYFMEADDGTSRTGGNQVTWRRRRQNVDTMLGGSLKSTQIDGFVEWRFLGGGRGREEQESPAGAKVDLFAERVEEDLDAGLIGGPVGVPGDNVTSSSPPRAIEKGKKNTEKVQASPMPSGAPLQMIKRPTARENIMVRSFFFIERDVGSTLEAGHLGELGELKDVARLDGMITRILARRRRRFGVFSESPASSSRSSAEACRGPDKFLKKSAMQSIPPRVSDRARSESAGPYTKSFLAEGREVRRATICLVPHRRRRSSWRASGPSGQRQ